MSTNNPGSPEHNPGEPTPGGYWDDAQSTLGSFPGETPQQAPVTTVTKPGIGDALGYGWKKFQGNWKAWLPFTLIYGALSLVAYLVTMTGTNMNFDPTSGTVENSIGPMYYVGMILSVAVSVCFSAFSLHGAFLEVSGRKPAIGDFFKATDRILPIFLLTVLIGLITVVVVGLPAVGLFVAGLMLLGVLIYLVLIILVLILTVFSSYAVVGDAVGPIEGLKRSFALGKANFGTILLLNIVLAILSFIGVMLLGLGLLVVVPVATIGYAYYYRAATGGQVSVAA